MSEVCPIKVYITLKRGGRGFKSRILTREVSRFLFNSQLHSFSIPLLILTVSIDFEKKSF